MTKKWEIKAGIKKADEYTESPQEFSSLASQKFMLSKVVKSFDEISKRLLSFDEIDLNKDVLSAERLTKSSIEEF